MLLLLPFIYHITAKAKSKSCSIISVCLQPHSVICKIIVGGRLIAARQMYRKRRKIYYEGNRYCLPNRSMRHNNTVHSKSEVKFTPLCMFNYNRGRAFFRTLAYRVRVLSCHQAPRFRRISHLTLSSQPHHWE